MLLRVARLAFLTPDFANLAFYRGQLTSKKLFSFLGFSLQYLFFWRQLAHNITLVSWLFNYLAEKCY